MSRLEEDKANSTSQIADAQAETEKREERLRAMATKVGLIHFILSRFFLVASTGCFIPSVNYQHQVFSAIHGAILKPFDMVIAHMGRFDILYGNP